jgi:hypothetical protein
MSELDKLKMQIMQNQVLLATANALAAHVMDSKEVAAITLNLLGAVTNLAAANDKLLTYAKLVESMEKGNRPVQ